MDLSSLSMALCYLCGISISLYDKVFIVEFSDQKMLLSYFLIVFQNQIFTFFFFFKKYLMRILANVDSDVNIIKNSMS